MNMNKERIILMMKPWKSVVIVPLASMVFLICIAGCPPGTPAPNDNEGTPVPNDNGGTPAPNDNGGEPGGGVSFKDDVEPILTSICGTCHTAGGIADQRGIPVRLDGSDGFDGLFNGSSIQDQNLEFVVAGDPDNSLAYLKISTDTPPVGARMPLSSPALSQAEQDLIRTWIAEGAKDN
jgi:hypothetical protein